VGAYQRESAPHWAGGGTRNVREWDRKQERATTATRLEQGGGMEVKGGGSTHAERGSRAAALERGVRRVGEGGEGGELGGGKVT